ncbi:hypothetical protein DL96DRAFT_1784598 [Flagelloscypha sp. PMI_526]|nr:hypothetical protein DL96DRAFT_1784598 [Flagelloscypha sp. PMI_526]
MKRRENALPPKLSASSPKVVRVHKRARVPSLAQKHPKVIALADNLEVVAPWNASPIPHLTPRRPPLGPFSVAVNRKVSPLRRNTFGLKPSSPKVSVDITVIDGNGQRVKQERRVSNPRAKIRRPPETTQSSSDTELESSPQLVRKRRLIGRPAPKAIIISSDEESADEDTIVPPKPPKIVCAKLASRSNPSPSSNDTVLAKVSKRPLPTAVLSNVTQSVPTILAVEATPSSAPNSLPFKPSQSPKTSAPRARQLTPIRGPHRFPVPPSPTEASESDFELDSVIDISAFDIETMCESELPALTPNPTHLIPLLEECRQLQGGASDFSSFIKMFPLDPVVRTRGGNNDSTFRKIGEASYSEVYGIGEVVLKVVPLRDESLVSHLSETHEEVDTPYESDAKDVLKEIIVTRAMGNVCGHFVELFKAYVVKGRYPQTLLELWDEFSATKGSENVFPASQHYAIIILPNGGLDLEAYRFTNAAKTGWRQACSIFWQVAKTLAHAERLVSFEHRDLHWGQILVNNTGMLQPLKAQNKNLTPVLKSSKWMDSPSLGIQVTLIDLGLSRMDAGDGHGGEIVHWSDFDATILAGEGDYQFDIYRNMHTFNGGNWEAFNPYTNVMWLHYLVLKLIHHKNLRVPTSPRKSQHPTAKGNTAPGTTFSERECYECLLDIESWLSHSLSLVLPPMPKTRTRSRKAPIVTPPILSSVSPACAGEVVAYAEKKRWVKAF